MNLYDAIAYQCDLFYSPIFELAEMHEKPLWGIVMAMKPAVDAKGKEFNLVRPIGYRAHTLDSLTGDIFNRLGEEDKLHGVFDGNFAIQIPLGLALWQPRWGGSMTKAMAHAPAVLMLDIDVSDAGHSDKELPLPTRADAEKLIADIETDLGIPFTAIAESGGTAEKGLHAYIATAEPITGDLLDQWNSYVRGVFNAAGFWLDELGGTGAQMMRVVGSTHTGTGQRARWIRSNSGRVENSILRKALPIPEAVIGFDGRPVSYYLNLITADNVFEAPADYYAKPKKRKGDLEGRPGDALDAILDPLTFLSEFYPIERSVDGTATMARPDGTLGNEAHIKTNKDGWIFLWGQRVISSTGLVSGHKHGYKNFGIICNGFMGGDVKRTSFLLGWTYRQTGGGQEWVQAITDYLKKHKTVDDRLDNLPVYKSKGSKAA